MRKVQKCENEKKEGRKKKREKNQTGFKCRNKLVTFDPNYKTLQFELKPRPIDQIFNSFLSNTIEMYSDVGEEMCTLERLTKMILNGTGNLSSNFSKTSLFQHT